jgi:hypothetical protein
MARICEQIRREDQAMADRILQGLPLVVAEHMRDLASRPDE